MTAQGLHVHTDRRGDLVVVRASGSLDERYVALLRSESLALPEEWATLLLDLSGVGYIDSAGVGAIVALYKKAREGNRRFGVCGPQKMPRSILELCRLNLIIPIFSSTAEAERALEEGGFR